MGAATAGARIRLLQQHTPRSFGVRFLVKESSRKQLEIELN